MLFCFLYIWNVRAYDMCTIHVRCTSDVRTTVLHTYDICTTNVRHCKLQFQLLNRSGGAGVQSAGHEPLKILKLIIFIFIFNSDL